MELGAESETNNINLHIDAVNIKQLKSIKLFCVFLDSELNFSEHISFVCKKASQQIWFLRRLRKLIPTHAKITTKQSCHIASLDLLQRHLVFLHAEPQTNVKLKDYRRQPLERFSTMSQSPTTNCWGWLNSLHLSTEGFGKLRFSCLRQRRINFQVKYRNFSCWKQTVRGDIR